MTSTDDGVNNSKVHFQEPLITKVSLVACCSSLAESSEIAFCLPSPAPSSASQVRESLCRASTPTGDRALQIPQYDISRISICSEPKFAVPSAPAPLADEAKKKCQSKSKKTGAGMSDLTGHNRSASAASNKEASSDDDDSSVISLDCNDLEGLDSETKYNLLKHKYIDLLYSLNLINKDIETFQQNAEKELSERWEFVSVKTAELNKLKELNESITAKVKVRKHVDSQLQILKPLTDDMQNTEKQLEMVDTCLRENLEAAVAMLSDEAEDSKQTGPKPNPVFDESVVKLSEMVIDEMKPNFINSWPSTVQLTKLANECKIAEERVDQLETSLKVLRCRKESLEACLAIKDALKD